MNHTNLGNTLTTEARTAHEKLCSVLHPDGYSLDLLAALVYHARLQTISTIADEAANEGIITDADRDEITKLALDAADRHAPTLNNVVCNEMGDEPPPGFEDLEPPQNWQDLEKELQAICPPGVDVKITPLDTATAPPTALGPWEQWRPSKHSGSKKRRKRRR